jgi:hypothetical protein
MLAVGWEEVGRFFEETPPENRQGVTIEHPRGGSPSSRSRSPPPILDAPGYARRDTVLWADLVLSLKTNPGTWTNLRLRVDAATEMTTMPAFEAWKLDLPIPKQPASRLVRRPGWNQSASNTAATATEKPANTTDSADSPRP